LAGWNPTHALGVITSTARRGGRQRMDGRTRLVTSIVLGCMSVAVLLYAASSLAFADEKDVLRTQIDQAEQQWNGQGITSYRIVVRRINSIWHAQTNTIIVVNGQVTEQSSTCITAPAEPQPCRIRAFDPTEFTVPGLFATARALTEKYQPDALTFRFDDVYGFPKSMLSNRPNVTDDDEGWGVESFTAL
jgi:hypothetical protein